MFTFNANGNTLVVTAEDISKVRATMFTDGLSDLVDAMSIANQEMLATDFKPGMWTLVDTVPNTYEWVEDDLTQSMQN